MLQINAEIVAGHFPVERDMVLRLAAWMAQIEWGDRDDCEVGFLNIHYTRIDSKPSPPPLPALPIYPLLHARLFTKACRRTQMEWLPR